MPFFRKYAISFLRILILCVIFFSCKKEDGGFGAYEIEGETDPRLARAWLSMNIKVISSGASTKADGIVAGDVNNGVNEDVVKSLAVFMVPVSEDGQEKWEESFMIYEPEVAFSSSSIYKTAVTTKLNVPMNVYVGANLTAGMAACFLENGRDAVYRTSAVTYPEMLKEFVSSEYGISMFCTEVGSVVFTEGHCNEDTPAIIDKNNDGVAEDVELVRMVAKVHMTFKCYDDHPEYVRITSPGTREEADFGEFGWSRLEDVSYILNTINFSSYIYQSAYEKAVSEMNYTDYRDPNHSMGNLLLVTNDWSYASWEFSRYDEDNMYDESVWQSWAAKPEQYVASRPPFGTTGERYVSGLYCFENTSTDETDLMHMSQDEKEYVPFMVATHFIVKARFVPRVIYDDVDAVGSPTSSKNFDRDEYDDALAFLEEVPDAVDENGNTVTYPQGTFFTRDMQEFYSYAGMRALIRYETEQGKQISQKNFASYPGGYGFYHSYIFGKIDEDTGKVSFSAETGYESGVFRNHYHILNCSLMKVPATPGSFNQLMMVNSKVVDWNPKGSLNMIVKPNV